MEETRRSTSSIVCRDKKMHQLFANEIQVAKNAQNKSIDKAKIYILSNIKNMLLGSGILSALVYFDPQKSTFLSLN